MNTESIAHDIHSDVWRSDDINLSTYVNQSNEIEIKTPSGPFNNDTDKDGKEYFLKNTDYTTFSLININEQIVAELKRCGFVSPSPIQTTCIPLARLGIDLIAQSKSGTGKTIVFVVTALEMIVQDQTPCPKVLIVAPTREIALQIADLIDSLTMNWNSFSCYRAIGGTKVSDNISQLHISQIIVGTPGRISSLLEMNFLKSHSIRLFILDECDKLMDENFKKQINKIYNYLPVNKQMIVTSATLSTEMTNYLSQYMRDPALVRLNANKPSLIGVMQCLLPVDGHCLDYLNFESKIDSLLYLLKNIQFNQCFIFLNYQTRVKYLYERLNSNHLSVIYITGDMSMKERVHTIELFRKGKFKIFVSTDLTSRGIDIQTVNLVINLDVPFDCETYLHRIGRSGRFGSSGISITIVGKNEEQKKFYSMISQYNLEVKVLDLPLTVNLWDIFYQEKIDQASSGINSLKVNPMFTEIESLYYKLKNELNNNESIDEDDEEEVFTNSIEYLDKDYMNLETILDEYNSLLETIFIPMDSASTDKSVENFTINSKETNDNEAKENSSLNLRMKNEDLNETIININENTNRDKKIFETSTENNNNNNNDNNNDDDYNNNDDEDSNENTSIEINDQNFDNDHYQTINLLFRQAFLRPIKNITKNPTILTNNNHNLICRYLLKGGKF